MQQHPFYCSSLSRYLWNLYGYRVPGIKANHLNLRIIRANRWAAHLSTVHVKLFCPFRPSWLRRNHQFYAIDVNANVICMQNKINAWYFNWSQWFIFPDWITLRKNRPVPWTKWCAHYLSSQGMHLFWFGNKIITQIDFISKEKKSSIKICLAQKWSLYGCVPSHCDWMDSIYGNKYL